MKRIFIITLVITAFGFQSCSKDIVTERERVENKMVELDNLILTQQAEGGVDSEAFLDAMLGGVMSFTQVYMCTTDNEWIDYTAYLSDMVGFSGVFPILFNDDNTCLRRWELDAWPVAGYDMGKWSYDPAAFEIEFVMGDCTDLSKVLYYKDNVAIIEGRFADAHTFYDVEKIIMQTSYYRYVVSFDRMSRKEYMREYESVYRTAEQNKEIEQQRIAEKFAEMDEMIRAQQTAGGFDSAEFTNCMHNGIMMFQQTYIYTDTDEWRDCDMNRYLPDRDDIVFFDDGTYCREDDFVHGTPTRTWSYDAATQTVTFVFGDRTDTAKVLYFRDNKAIIEGNFADCDRSLDNHMDKWESVYHRYVVYFDMSDNGREIFMDLYNHDRDKWQQVHD